MTFSSLRTKLILILLVLLSLLATATGLATLNTMKRDSELQAGHILNVAGKVLGEALNNRASQLSSSVQILATDFGFRRAVATAEQDTIESVLANHGNRINASLTLLLSPNGTLLASSDNTIKTTDIAPLFQQTLGHNTAAVNDILHLAGQPYQLVLAPVRAPALIAWVGMGFPLDSTLATQIRGVTDLDISFVAEQPQGYQLYTSTLDDPHQLQLPALLDTLINKAGKPHTNPQQDYISQAMPLDKQQQLWAIQHLSNQRWLSSYQQFRHQLLLIFGAALSLTLLAGIIFARSITQPLKALSYFARRIGQGFDETIPVRGNDEVALLGRTLSAMQHDIRQREQQLQFHAEHDSLTGLYNRTAVERLLPSLLANSDGSLLQINIQQFKHINDVLGFSNGDILLQQLARRLKLGPEMPVMLARLGGDEFLLVYNILLTEAQMRAKLAALGEGYQLADTQINLKICIGMYHFFCQQSNVNDALRRVDIALDNARLTPQRTAIYLQGQDESHQRELMLIRDLPEALHNGQFYAVYQPKIDLASQQCHSAEALIRWQHPKLGLIAPDEFIRLAEHSGNISLISDWMLQQVIAQTAKWQQQGLHLQIAVNLSVYDLLNPALADNINAQLQQYQLSAAALALEVTESAIMQDTATVITQLQRIRSLGITLAIDDFGTGQSSLAYLKQLPVHELKIDRAFVKDIDHNSNDALIVTATTQLAHSLGFVVTAEGLENQAGLAKLQQCGCDKVQGYYFSRPLHGEAFVTWLQQYNSLHPHWLNAQAVK